MTTIEIPLNDIRRSQDLGRQPVARATTGSSVGPGGRSFDQLYTEKYEQMVRLACCLVDLRPVAEDVVQDSFRQLWQRWDSVTNPCSYLRTSVVNGCHNELRRRRVRRDAWHKLVDRPDEDPHYLADALADICEQRRKALVLRFYGGRTMNEIAEAMKIPTGTAKSLIHRGLADLRGALN
ncbi:MAG: sigma-70 family RNA polymerase sigma factor [Acidimicrobiia bacterium]|nr:sigma-70 family RNA polymerase sigma factor [Acidimicrobiia bacterium]